MRDQGFSDTALPRLRLAKTPGLALLVTMLCSQAVPDFAQGPPPPHKGAEPAPVTTSGQKVTINYLNVCAPSDAEAQQIASALARIPRKPAVASDFEISHGRLRVKETGISHYVRLRRDLDGGPFLNVQYSISADEKNIDETLSFRSRDARDVLQVSIEDRVSSSAALPGVVVGANTPATHVNVERFGKPSLGLARCVEGDQTAYQKIFDEASAVLQHYREDLGLRSTFKSDIAWLDSMAARSTGRTKRDDAGARLPGKK